VSELETNPAFEYIDGLATTVSERLKIDLNVDPIKEFSHPAFGNLGWLKVIDGGDHPDVLKIIRLRLNFAPVGMEANAVHVITKPDSVIPHAVIEAIFHDPKVETPFRPAHDGPPQIGFFMNSVNRVDLGVNLKYMQHIYAAYEESLKAILEDEAIRVAPLPRIQLAAMSPWAAPITCPWEKFDQGKALADLYMNTTLDLIDNGMPEGVVSDEEKARSAYRDKLNRPTYLDREVDHIWGTMEKMIGPEDTEKLMGVLTSQDVETSF